MKRKRIRIKPQAQQEINEAFDWYFKHSPEAADAFLTEIGASLTQIASHPQPVSYTHLFKRKENPPLMNCIAFSNETSGAGVMSAWKWSGMMTNACKTNFPCAR